MIVIILYKSNENFDGKISNISFNKCGRYCTNLYGCEGFSHDYRTKNCYLSRQPIDKHNCTSPFIDEYDERQSKCNKISGIPEYYDGLLTERKRLNMFYKCQDNDMDETITVKKIVNDTSKNVDVKEIPLHNYEPYIMQDTIWPVNKEEFKQRKVFNPIMDFL
jgi:hypothetical protein